MHNRLAVEPDCHPNEATARLSHGASITQVAFELAFRRSSAFTSVFRRNLGDSPARYLAKSKAASSF